MTAALSNPSNSDMYSREFAAFVKSFRDLAVSAAQALSKLREVVESL